MAARRAIKAVLVDLSGTLHIEDSAVPGAQEALKKLRSAPVAVRFVTNTTKECKQDLLERLKQLDFDIKEDEIFTSLTAARNLLEQKKVRPLLMVEKNALRDFTGALTIYLQLAHLFAFPFHLQDCRDDVGGAQNAGMLGILVKTGKYRDADEDKIHPPPYLICESFPHAVEHILQHLL
ncbi:haloacid dehalogenase-like hydrolase domain-containing protein 2 [Notechis scutatus]|uniref:Haloacid dehalogenase-like hydrolase domain-containing protein 2 n=1 Tax=Notechis scutatus TaxID=8663 RepID=A0A6J1VJZ1_9SAUR|nr:haloacid dehalogenase-like hydrolase domain-containing protein 2 [Notechis scutatus]